MHCYSGRFTSLKLVTGMCVMSAISCLPVRDSRGVLGERMPCLHPEVTPRVAMLLLGQMKGQVVTAGCFLGNAPWQQVGLPPVQ